MQVFRHDRQVFVLGLPYPLSVFEETLDRIVESRADSFNAFADNLDGVEGRTWYVRHDLDTRYCLDQVPIMLDASLSRGIRPGCFFNLQGEGFRKDQAIELFHEYSSRGVVFGLHSVCYVQSDWRIALEHEVQTFMNIFGAPPESLNAHGLGSVEFGARMRFYWGVGPRQLKSFGIGHSDLSGRFRRYQYVIQDCDFANPPSESVGGPMHLRGLFTDWLSLPPMPAGSKGLILTHPGYWVK